MMFLPEQISKLNELETLVFDFIIKSPEEVQQMTIRDLASQAHVSTSTIVRLCTKLGFEGWSDLKFYLKNNSKKKHQKSNIMIICSNSTCFYVE